MKTTIRIGKKIMKDYGYKQPSLVTIDLELKDKKENKLVFSASGNIWNTKKTDIISGEQNLDEIFKLFPNNKLVSEIYRLWKRWHLNDLNPDCIHQKNNEIEFQHKNITLYTFRLKKKFEPEEIISKIKNNKNFLKDDIILSIGEQKILTSKLYYHHIEFLPEGLADFYEKTSSETKDTNWITYSDLTPSGLLGKPCDICGYKYGTDWLFEPISEDDLSIIKHIIEYHKLPN